MRVVSGDVSERVSSDQKVRERTCGPASQGKRGKQSVRDHSSGIPATRHLHNDDKGGRDDSRTAVGDSHSRTLSFIAAAVVLHVCASRGNRSPARMLSDSVLLPRCSRCCCCRRRMQTTV